MLKKLFTPRPVSKFDLVFGYTCSAIALAWMASDWILESKDESSIKKQSRAWDDGWNRGYDAGYSTGRMDEKNNRPAPLPLI